MGHKSESVTSLPVSIQCSQLALTMVLTFFLPPHYSYWSAAYQLCLLLCRDSQKSWEGRSYLLKGERRVRNLRPGRERRGMCT